MSDTDRPRMKQEDHPAFGMPYPEHNSTIAVADMPTKSSGGEAVNRAGKSDKQRQPDDLGAMGWGAK